MFSFVEGWKASRDFVPDNYLRGLPVTSPSATPLVADFCSKYACMYVCVYVNTGKHPYIPIYMHMSTLSNTTSIDLHMTTLIFYACWPPGGGFQSRTDGRQRPSSIKKQTLMRVPRTGIWVVVKIMVPCWVLNIIRYLVFRGPKRGPYLVLTTTHLLYDIWYKFFVFQPPLADQGLCFLVYGM